MAKIAEFRLTGYPSGNFRSVWHFDRVHENGAIPGYVRVSEWIDVDFPPRVESDVPEELAQLDAKLDELKADFAKKVNAIETAKANLLAISDQRESA